MRYYISDLHLWHRALLTKMDVRGFDSVEQMHDVIIENWNSRVRRNDEVILLGDVSWENWSKTKEILDCLNGKLFLITGNHDRFLTDKTFDPSYFGWVKPYAELNDERRKVICFHYPIACYNGQYRLMEDGRPRTYMLHGHIHATHDQDLIDAYQKMVNETSVMGVDGQMRKIPCQLINCFCGYSNYVPLTLDEWIEFHKKRHI